jgi:hypothetical protein
MPASRSSAITSSWRPYWHRRRWSCSATKLRRHPMLSGAAVSRRCTALHSRNRWHSTRQILDECIVRRARLGIPDLRVVVLAEEAFAAPWLPLEGDVPTQSLREADKRRKSRSRWSH